MTNLQAAVGVAQLKNIEKLVDLKRENAKKYTKLLKHTNGLELPVEKEYAKNVYWMYGIVLDKSLGFDARALAEKLLQHGIQTRPFFYPLHLQPVWKKMKIKIKPGKYPVAERIAKYGLYLPSGLGLKKEEVKEVCDTIKKLLT